MCLTHSHSGGAGLFRYSGIPSLPGVASLFHCSRHPCLLEQDTLLPASLPPRAGHPGSASRSRSNSLLHSPTAFSRDGVRVPVQRRGGTRLLCPAGEPGAVPAAERKGGQLGAVPRQSPLGAAAGRALRCAFWHGPGPLLSR